MQGMRLPGRLGDFEEVADVRCKARGARKEPGVVRRRQDGMCGVLLKGTFERTGMGFVTVRKDMQGVYSLVDMV